MSDFCKQVKTDANAYAICEYLAENYGLDADDFDQGVSRVVRPKGWIAYLAPGAPDGDVEAAEVYAKAIELAEVEEDGIRARYGDSFELDYDAPLHGFLAENDMRIPWLFMNARPGDRNEWLFERIQWKVDGFHPILALRGIEEGTPEYRRALAIEILEFIKKPASRGGMGIEVDKEDTDRHGSISEAMAAGRASCIEFLVVYTAIARQAGLDVRPVEVYTSKKGNPIDHVIVGVELGDGETLLINVNGKLGLDPKQRWSFMSKSDLLAHDYNARSLLNCIGRDGKSDNACARGYVDQALAFSPKNYMVLFNLGYMEYDYSNDLESSLYYLKSSKAEFPGHAETRYNLSVILDDLGRHDEAEEERKAYFEIRGDTDKK